MFELSQRCLPFLYALAELRTPFLDAFFSVFTELGGETMFMVIGLIVFWCVDKRKGHYLLFVALCGTVFNQALKIKFGIPRPWVLDPEFQIVEAARAEATGFSFPSGHTQNAVGIFGGIARFCEKTLCKALFIVIALLVAFSRMYLGVHTPLDVGVSLIVAAVLVLALYRPMMRVRSLTKLWLLALIPTLLYLFYADAVARASLPLPEYAEAVKNGWCMLGAISGCAAITFVDERFIGFETKAVWWAQILKVVFGLALVVAVKSLLKAPLYALLGQGSGIADAIRYCAMVLAAGALWPVSFAYFARLGKK
jgi:undecaprenyl-diphosphatase